MAATTQKIENYLEVVVKRDASDLHLQVGVPPQIRLDGRLAAIEDAPVLQPADLEQLVYSLLDDEQKEVLIKDKEVDFSFSFGQYGRFRVNAFHERGNLAAALRLIPTKIRTLEDLGMPKVVMGFADLPRGLVLVTGPTGSGKSTTLAALVDKINSEKAAHILTIEDPIEYAHNSKKSIVVQREIHYDTYSFAAALRSSLRQDPDVVLIGEMRDLETISAAITIAETGHLVLATLHTNSAAQSIDRMVDVFPPHQQQQIRVQLAGMLQAICAQRLVPTIGGGRIAAAEILVATPAIRNIIREGKTHQIDAAIQTGAEYGMQSMDRTLVNLIHSGKITYEEAKNFAVDVSELDRLMRG
jgi:twitching motility protein PilT